MGWRETRAPVPQRVKLCSSVEMMKTGVKFESCTVYSDTASAVHGQAAHKARDPAKQQHAQQPSGPKPAGA